MKVTTKVFGEITVDEDKIITFPQGIIGFPDLTKFALIHDSEKGNETIHWLQSLQETAFAMPVVDPLLIRDNYNPEVEDELLKQLGTLHQDDMLVLVTVTVPKDLTKMSVNLKGPIIINSAERKAVQVIVEGNDYQVKYPIYEILNQKKEAGE